jgi:hypothetical protein
VMPIETFYQPPYDSLRSAVRVSQIGSGVGAGRVGYS